MSTPHAQVIQARRNPSAPGAYIVTVRCPLCTDPHTHGVPSLEELRAGTGHRVAHCTHRRDWGGYVVDPYDGPVMGAVMRRA